MSVNEPVETRMREAIQIELAQERSPLPREIIQEQLDNNVDMMSKVIAYTKVEGGTWVAAGSTVDWSAVTSIKTEGLEKKNVGH